MRRVSNCLGGRGMQAQIVTACRFDDAMLRCKAAASTGITPASGADGAPLAATRTSVASTQARRCPVSRRCWDGWYLCWRRRSTFPFASCSRLASRCGRRNAEKLISTSPRNGTLELPSSSTSFQAASDQTWTHLIRIRPRLARGHTKVTSGPLTMQQTN